MSDKNVLQDWIAKTWRFSRVTLLLLSVVGCSDGSSPTGLDVEFLIIVEEPSVSRATVGLGRSFELSVTVWNAGGASAGARLTYYRSTDATIATSDVEVGTGDVVFLAPGFSKNPPPSIDLSAPDAAGTYYYGACVADLYGEVYSTNNCSGTVSVTVAVGPDLVVRAPSLDDGSLKPSQSFTLSAAVDNAGDGAAAPTTLTYYLSDDATISTSDISMGIDAVSALAAGKSTTQSVSLPAAGALGIYYYGACVGAVPEEFYTANNCSPAVRVTVTTTGVGPDPDLVVESASVDDFVLEPSESFTLSAAVRNAGDADAAPTTLTYYLSDDATISRSDISVGTDTVSAVARGFADYLSIGVTAPGTVGTYYYGACVTPVWGESDTTNNCSPAVRVTVTTTGAAAADLVVKEVWVADSSLDSSESFTLYTWVWNAGDTVSPITTVSYYLSDDATISTFDVEVGSDTIYVLGVSNLTVESLRLAAPAVAGTYYYGACVAAVSGEYNTANNCSSAVSVVVRR